MLALCEGLNGVQGDVASEVVLVLAGGQRGVHHRVALHKAGIGDIGELGDEPFLLQPLVQGLDHADIDTWSLKKKIQV